MAWDPLSRLLFPMPTPSYSSSTFGHEELIWIPKDLKKLSQSPKEECVPCLFLKYPSARFLILLLHSNAEDLGRCYGFCQVLRLQFQVHVLAVEYPGYGVCPGGQATADSATENAFAAFRFVREILQWPLESILIMGRSIGTGPAISLAVQYKVHGLILVAPFLSIRAIAKEAVGALGHLLKECFPNEGRMHFVQSPVLIIHGMRDTLIPYHHGVKLWELTRSRKLLVAPKDMEHNTSLLVNPEFFEVPMLQFFALPDYSFQELTMPGWVYRDVDRWEIPRPKGLGPRPTMVKTSILRCMHREDEALADPEFVPAERVPLTKLSL